MRRNNVNVLLCCLMLYFGVLTDAYGLSVQVGKKDGDAKPIKQIKKYTKQVTSAPINYNKMADNPTLGSQVRQQISKSYRQSEVIKPDDKLSYEINELNRMHKQLIKEIANDPTNSRKIQLQKEIEKQLKVRKMQQLSKGAGRRKRVKQTRLIKQLYDPTKSLASISSDNMIQKSKTTLNHQNNENRSDTKTLTELSLPVRNNKVQQTLISHGSIAPSIQSEKLQGAQHVIYPKRFIHQNQLTRLNDMNKAALQQISAGHVLVPVSSLSSTGTLNNRGVLSNRFIVIKRFKSAIPVIALTGNSTKTTMIKLPAGLNTSNISATSSSSLSTFKEQLSSTTSLPTSATSVPVSTTMSDFVTTSDATSIKDNFLKGKIKKQQLEIRKLKLEIRALVREENQNQPEIENEEIGHQTPPI